MTRQESEKLLHERMSKTGCWLSAGECADYLRSQDATLSAIDAMLLARAFGTPMPEGDGTPDHRRPA